jgi:hypothetical protein
VLQRHRVDRRRQTARTLCQDGRWQANRSELQVEIDIMLFLGHDQISISLGAWSMWVTRSRRRPDGTLRST